MSFVKEVTNQNNPQPFRTSRNEPEQPRTNWNEQEKSGTIKDNPE